jgi:cytochrome b561
MNAYLLVSIFSVFIIIIITISVAERAWNRKGQRSWYLWHVGIGFLIILLTIFTVPAGLQEFRVYLTLNTAGWSGPIP